MKRNFVTSIIQRAKFILVLSIVYAALSIHALGQTPIVPDTIITIPPYDNATASVAVELNDTTLSTDSSLTGSISYSYDELSLATFEVSDSKDYVFGVLTNNTNEYLIIRGNPSETNTILEVTNNSASGFAGGIIYQSSTPFIGMLGYPVPNNDVLSLDVTSGGDAIGVGFLKQNTYSGIYNDNNFVDINIDDAYYYIKIHLGDVNVESTQGGNAVGVIANDLVCDSTYNTDYNSFVVNSISVVAKSGDAIGIKLHDIIGYADVNVGAIAVESDSGDAIGMLINDIAISTPSYNSDTYFGINIIGVSAKSNTGDAFGVKLNDIRGDVDFSVDTVSAESDSGKAVGVWLNDVSSYVYSSYYTYTPEVTFGNVVAKTESGSAIGVRVDNVGGYIGVGSIDVTAESTDSNVYGFLVEGLINPHTASTDGGEIYLGDVNVQINAGNVTAIGVAATHEHQIEGTLSVSNITASSTGSAIGLELIGGVGENTPLQIYGAITATAGSGSAYGIKAGNESSSTFNLGEITIAYDIIAASEEGEAYGIYSYAGKNTITIDTSNSYYPYYPEFAEFVQITGQSGDNTKAAASIFLQGKDNKLIIGTASAQNGEEFNNHEQAFTVIGAQEITFNTETTLSGKSFFEKSEIVTINKNLTLNNDSYFDPTTKKVTIAQDATADFGASKFTYLILDNDGTALFNHDQIFDGIYGDDIDVFEDEDSNGLIDENETNKIIDNGRVIVHGNAIFAGAGNYGYSGWLKADNVIVDKKHLDPSAIGSHADIGTQSIGELETGILTIDAGTLNILRTAKVDGLESNTTEVNGLVVDKTDGKLTGSQGASIEINATEDHHYAGLLKMDYITKKGQGKQTIGQLESNHAVIIKEGSIDVLRSANIEGVKNKSDSGNLFNVKNNLILNVGIDEFIKPNGDKKYRRHHYIFDGTINAGIITKAGKGTQEATIINAGLVTFGKQPTENNTEISFVPTQLDPTTGILMSDLEGLLATSTMYESGELIATQRANLGGIEGTGGKLTGGDFFIDLKLKHTSDTVLDVKNLTVNGQGEQTIGQLSVENILTVNNASLIVDGNIDITDGIEGDNGSISGKNVQLGGKIVEQLDGRQVRIEGDDKDHFYTGSLNAHNITKYGNGLQTFNKLTTTNDLFIAEGHIESDQLNVEGVLSLAENTSLLLDGSQRSYIGATGNLFKGKFAVHGPGKAGDAAVIFGGDVNMHNIRTIFNEEPDQFITWKIGSNGIYAVANKTANMSESYLTSLLLHDSRAAWTAISERFNMGVTAGENNYYNNLSRTLPKKINGNFENQYNNLFRAQSPKQNYFDEGGDRSFWVNYIGRTGKFKSTFTNTNFKLRGDGVQIGYDVIPAQTIQYGIMFGYEGQSSTNNLDIVTADDCYLAVYGSKLYASGIDLRAMFGYGHQSYNLTRYAKWTAGIHKAAYSGDTLEGIIEVGHRFGLLDRLTFRPVFAVELYYNMLDRAKEDDISNAQTAVIYDVSTLKQTLLRFGSDLRYDIRRFTFLGGMYYTLNCGNSNLSTTVSDQFEQRLPLVGNKLGRSIITADFGGQYFCNALHTRSFFVNYSGNLYVDRKGTPFDGTFHIGFQFDF